jgi:hypothetical protein
VGIWAVPFAFVQEITQHLFTGKTFLQKLLSRVSSEVCAGRLWGLDLKKMSVSTPNCLVCGDIPFNNRSSLADRLLNF